MGFRKKKKDSLTKIRIVQLCFNRMLESHMSSQHTTHLSSPLQKRIPKNEWFILPVSNGPNCLCHPVHNRSGQLYLQFFCLLFQVQFIFFLQWFFSKTIFFTHILNLLGNCIFYRVRTYVRSARVRLDVVHKWSKREVATKMSFGS